MKKHLQTIRNKILYDLWEKNKNFLAMEDLAEILKIDLKSVYRILKAENKPNKKI